MKALRKGIILTICLMLVFSLFGQKEKRQELTLDQMRTEIAMKGLTFTVGENDALDKPLDNLCGLVEPPDWRQTGKFDGGYKIELGLPTSWDWRDQGVVTNIQNQGSCGSCWAFGTIGSYESCCAVAGGTLYDLSEQWLLDCNTMGYSCSGGWWGYPDMYDGVPLESCYPYVGYQQSCSTSCPKYYPMDEWYYVGNSSSVPSTEDLKNAIYTHGPISAAVYVDSYFQAYTGGIFSNTASYQPNHAIVLVGWNDSGGYWILKNSWGTGWGESGYMRIEYGANNVGYAAAYGVPESIIPQPPVADFTADPNPVQVGNSVQFTDLTTNTPTSWSWTFEGGSPANSTDQNPSVTYNTIGTYTVTLTAENALGSDTETKTDYINVQEVVIEYCDSSGNSQSYEYIAGVEVADLYNSSGATGYSDFTYMTANLVEGESASVSLTPGFPGSSYTEWWKIWIDYNIDGDFEDAGEEVFSGSGSSTVSGNFTVPGTASGLTRMRVSMSYSTYPPYCGTFTYGEVEDYTVNISGGGGDPPVADFSASATTITEGQTIDFTDLSTNTPTSWSWTFNGGTPSSSTAQNPSVTYNIAGTYTVELTAANAYGSDTETKVNYITVNPPAPPVADFTASSTTITEGQSVDFTDLSSNNPTSWSWTFYGGTPSSSTAQNPTVTYNTAGTYTVELTASNSGGSDDEIKTDYITVNPPSTGITFENGTLSNVGSTWQTVTLQNTYTSMVVVCSTGLDNSSTLPAVVRVRNASGNSFDVKVQNPGDGSALSGYPVHYFVVEEGVYTEAADGVKMEAVKVNSTATARQGSWVREARSYQNSYTSPVVLGQVMTNNDADWSVFWACAARTSPPSASSFYAGKHVGEDTDTTRANETIGYVVFEQGSGTINSTPFRAAVGSDIVKGPDNTSTGYTYTFTSVPNANAAIVSAAGMDGGNGGWPVMYGATPLTSTSLTMVFDEDQIKDSERNHVNEQVAYIVFGQ